MFFSPKNKIELCGLQQNDMGSKIRLKCSYNRLNLNRNLHSSNRTTNYHLRVTNERRSRLSAVSCDAITSRNSSAILNWWLRILHETRFIFLCSQIPPFPTCIMLLCYMRFAFPRNKINTKYFHIFKGLNKRSQEESGKVCGEKVKVVWKSNKFKEMQLLTSWNEQINERVGKESSCEIVEKV